MRFEELLLEIFKENNASPEKIQALESYIKEADRLVEEQNQKFVDLQELVANNYTGTDTAVLKVEKPQQPRITEL